jgi:hypothetical protein
VSSYSLDFNAKLGRLVQDHALQLVMQPSLPKKKQQQQQQTQKQQQAMQESRCESLDIPVVVGGEFWFGFWRTGVRRDPVRK